MYFLQGLGSRWERGGETHKPSCWLPSFRSTANILSERSQKDNNKCKAKFNKKCMTSYLGGRWRFRPAAKQSVCQRCVSPVLLPAQQHRVWRRELIPPPSSSFAPWCLVKSQPAPSGALRSKWTSENFQTHALRGCICVCMNIRHENRHFVNHNWILPSVFQNVLGWRSLSKVMFIHTNSLLIRTKVQLQSIIAEITAQHLTLGFSHC